MSKILFTSESVSEGHPDKICDQISDAVLDAVLSEDPENSRVACECFTTTGLIVVGGEITTNTYIDLPKLVRGVIRDIGYTRAEYRFDAESCAVVNVINKQSPDIAMGVDTGGAGDQGMMFGYACSETQELMPAALMFSHKIVEKLASIRKKESHKMPYLRPDAKAQVTLEYNPDNSVKRIDTVVVSTQHDSDVTQKEIRDEVLKYVLNTVLPVELLDEHTIYHINPTGRFEIGGPHGDTGLTGRKIIVDTYGGKAPHGGGAFSGKDPTKVDRSAAYATRHLAKNIVAAGLASECTIQVSYAIGVIQPVSLLINFHGTGVISENIVANFIAKNIDMSPIGIIRRLNLRRPMYRSTAAYGHFGKHGLPWEELNLLSEFSSLLT